MSMVVVPPPLHNSWLIGMVSLFDTSLVIGDVAFSNVSD